MKIIFRWTCGNLSGYGLECLRISLRQVKKLFPGAPRVVCYNGDGRLDVDCEDIVYQQGDWVGPAWKLATPRLLMDGFEVYIDSDVVFLEKIPLELWQPSWGFISWDRFAAYGNYGTYLPQDYCVNSGLFGLPPGFEFDELVQKYLPREWKFVQIAEENKKHCLDEQGLVAYVFYKYLPHWVIPNQVLGFCVQKWKYKKIVHFIGLNRRERHPAFEKFLQEYEGV